MNKDFDIVLAITSHRGLSPPTAHSLEKMRLNQHQLGFTYSVAIFVGDALLSRARSQACTKFLEETKAPYMLFIDDDIAFEPEHVVKVYRHLSSKKYDLIGGIYPVRGASQLSSYGWGGKLMPDGQVQEIEFLATGFMGISRTLLEKMITDLKLPILNANDWSRSYPFFECGRFENRERGGDPIYISEDWDFPLVPTTQIMSNSFTWKALGDVQIGDKLIGFVDRKGGNYRAYCEAIVTDMQEQTLDTYRIITEDGELIVSSKHPLLAVSPGGTAPRWITAEHLHIGQRLKKPIQHYDNPKIDKDYMMGYLKGIWEGDGTIDKHGYATLEMTDKEAVTRASEYTKVLNLPNSPITERQLTNTNWKPLFKLYCGQGIPFIEGMSIFNESMAKGFLAGVYDAEGSYSKGRLRIAGKDKRIRNEIEQALRYIGITEKDYTRPDGLWEYCFSNQESVFRFWQTTQPAISRKVGVDGQGSGAILQSTHPVITAIEKAGKRDVKCVTTDNGNFIANGFISHNCQKARKVGVQVYTDTSIQVDHLRENLFSVKDVQMNQAKAALDAQLYGAMNHQFQLIQKINDDLGDFFHMAPARVSEAIEHGQERLAQEWSDWKGTPIDFYKDNTTSLFDLAIFNQQQYYFEQRLGALIQVTGARILDIGCGIGTAVFTLAEHNNDVTGWDINQKAIDFANFKKEKHKLGGTFTTEQPDFSQFDLIIAIDMLEHIPDLQGFLLDLGKAMKVGAKLYHSDFFPKGEKNTWPMHYEEHQQHLSQWLKEAGLVEWDDKWTVKI